MRQAQPGGVVERLDRLYEFDREPVTRDRLCGGAYFAGAYAGEHVAATEFVIGALFVTWGASIWDIFVGLAIGNLLAVLSWALVCAPLAVQTRLTLYWYLRRIGGPLLTVIYNVLNALLFCVLAGCMITVSASAVRIPFGIPPQTHWYPTDASFVLTVCAVGAVVVWLAIAGFKRLAAFAAVCSPWMLLMFVLGALVMLPALAEATGLGPVDSFERFWLLGERAIWTGRTPDGGPPLLGFWHIAAFAWICNLAMHLGLSDMAIFRYARHAGYGLYSAFGMFLGHYVAWIAAGVMGAGAAALAGAPLTALDAGAVADRALGFCGAIAVVIAGWTTSNPTLYRAGLALQAVTPNWPRWLVTLAVGILTTMVACFPFVFTGLLNFVGLYGLLLAPPGAIVITEHWLFPRLGLRRYWAEQRGRLLNLPALAAWAAGMALALGLYLSDTLHLFFLFAPVYVVTSAVYIALASFAGAARRAAAPAAAAAPSAAHAPPREPGDSAMSPGAAASAARIDPHASPAASAAPQAVSRARAAPRAASRASAARRAGQASESVSPAGRPSRRAALWMSGSLAAAALLACLALALYVFSAPPAEFAGRLAWFKTWLLAPTLVYFVSATAWELRRAAPRG